MMEDFPIIVYRHPPPYLAHRRPNRRCCPCITRSRVKLLLCCNFIFALLYILFCGIKILNGWPVPVSWSKVAGSPVPGRTRGGGENFFKTGQKKCTDSHLRNITLNAPLTYPPPEKYTDGEMLS